MPWESWEVLQIHHAQTSQMLVRAIGPGGNQSSVQIALQYVRYHIMEAEELHCEKLSMTSVIQSHSTEGGGVYG